MKIVTIFADRLFAFHFKNEAENELRRLLNQWNDIFYLHQFVTSNFHDAPKNIPVQKLINQIIDDANDMDDLLIELSQHKSRSLEEIFKPLDNLEFQSVELSKQKGRINFLRLYAIKIDKNCFVITGGAIKFHHRNNERPHTLKEMRKIDRCRDYLKENGVYDDDSFYEFIINKV